MDQETTNLLLSELQKQELIDHKLLMLIKDVLVSQMVARLPEDLQRNYHGKDITELLLEEGVPPKIVANIRASAGRAIARKYRETYHREPLSVVVEVNGRARSVHYYSEDEEGDVRGWLHEFLHRQQSKRGREVGLTSTKQRSILPFTVKK